MPELDDENYEQEFKSPETVNYINSAVAEFYQLIHENLTQDDAILESVLAYNGLMKNGVGVTSEHQALQKMEDRLTISDLREAFAYIDQLPDASIFGSEKGDEANIVKEMPWAINRSQYNRMGNEVFSNQEEKDQLKTSEVFLIGAAYFTAQGKIFHKMVTIDYPNALMLRTLIMREVSERVANIRQDLINANFNKENFENIIWNKLSAEQKFQQLETRAQAFRTYLLNESTQSATPKVLAIVKESIAQVEALIYELQDAIDKKIIPDDNLLSKDQIENRFQTIKTNLEFAQEQLKTQHQLNEIEMNLEIAAASNLEVESEIGKTYNREISELQDDLKPMLALQSDPRPDFDRQPEHFRKIKPLTAEEAENYARPSKIHPLSADQLERYTQIKERIQEINDLLQNYQPHFGTLKQLRDLKNILSSEVLVSSQEKRMEVNKLIGEVNKLISDLSSITNTNLNPSVNKDKFADIQKQFQTIIDTRIIQKNYAEAEKNLSSLHRALLQYSTKNKWAFGLKKDKIKFTTENAQLIQNFIESFPKPKSDDLQALADETKRMQGLMQYIALSHEVTIKNNRGRKILSTLSNLIKANPIVNKIKASLGSRLEDPEFKPNGTLGKVINLKMNNAGLHEQFKQNLKSESWENALDNIATTYGFKDLLSPKPTISEPQHVTQPLPAQLIDLPKILGADVQASYRAKHLEDTYRTALLNSLSHEVATTKFREVAEMITNKLPIDQRPDFKTASEEFLAGVKNNIKLDRYFMSKFEVAKLERELAVSSVAQKESAIAPAANNVSKEQFAQAKKDYEPTKKSLMNLKDFLQKYIASNDSGIKSSLQSDKIELAKIFIQMINDVNNHGNDTDYDKNVSMMKNTLLMINVMHEKLLSVSPTKIVAEKYHHVTKDSKILKDLKLKDTDDAYYQREHLGRMGRFIEICTPDDVKEQVRLADSETRDALVSLYKENDEHKFTDENSYLNMHNWYAKTDNDADNAAAPEPNRPSR